MVLLVRNKTGGGSEPAAEFEGSADEPQRSLQPDDLHDQSEHVQMGCAGVQMVSESIAHSHGSEVDGIQFQRRGHEPLEAEEGSDPSGSEGGQEAASEGGQEEGETEGAGPALGEVGGLDA